MNTDALLLTLIVLTGGLTLAMGHSRPWVLRMSTLCALLMGVALIRCFFLEPIRHTGPSMAPSMSTSGWLVVNRQAYGWSWPVWGRHIWSRLPHRNDVVAFRQSQGIWVKRVRGIPGDSVRYDAHTGWWINNAWAAPPASSDMTWLTHAGVPDSHMITRRHTLKRIGESFAAHQSWSMSIPPGFIFVMGDNVAHSTDSRTVGLVHMSRVMGRVDWWSDRNPS